MSRTANAERPAALLDDIVRYLSTHGLHDFSLRPLARAVNSSPRVLLYYFGSKEQLVTDVLREIRHRQRDAYARLDATTVETACRSIWVAMRAADAEPAFRLFFEAYGLALQAPDRYADFLQGAIDDWLTLITGPLRAEGLSPANARAFATVVLAGLRGFMLDYCATHDRARLDRAVRLWSEALAAAWWLETQR